MPDDHVMDSVIDRNTALLLEKIRQETLKSMQKIARRRIADFVGQFDTRPSLESFLLTEHEQMLKSWVDTFGGIASSRFSKADQRTFLRSRGINIQYAGKKEKREAKLLHRTFLAQIREFATDFDVVAVVGTEWERVDHSSARQKFLRDQNKQDIEAFIDELTQVAVQEDTRETLYLFVRLEVSRQISRVFATAMRYEPTGETFPEPSGVQEVGRFDPEHYATVEDFLLEYTGEVKYEGSGRHATREFVQYESKVLARVRSVSIRELTSIILNQSNLQERFKTLSGRALMKEDIESHVLEWVSEHQYDYLGRISDELMKHLLAFSKLPRSFDVLRATYAEQCEERLYMQKMAAEEQRKMADEEQQKLHAIFDPEYHYEPRQDIRYVLHIGDTNTGKTYRTLERLKTAKSGLYLAPLRLLAFEVFERLSQAGINCSLKTGEEEVFKHPLNFLSATVEMFQPKDRYEVVGIDEGQMISDEFRGFSWFRSITQANADEVHIMGSKSAKRLLLKLLDGCNVTTNEYEREIPLVVDPIPFTFDKVRAGDALICFSRTRVLQTAAKLEQSGKKVSVIYGSMPPETRKKQVSRFLQGETNIVVSTDAIGMGLNLPIRRIVFLENEKFDGVSRRILTSQEVKQIAGRAGRKGLYEEGEVAFVKNPTSMAKLLQGKDVVLDTLTIAPTRTVLERFSDYHDRLQEFFGLWEKYDCPVGMQKANLTQEEMLYSMVIGTEIEKRFSIHELYDFLHLPFASDIPHLRTQWFATVEAIAAEDDLPSPIMTGDTLDELELSYKSIGLHLLFLYRLKRHLDAKHYEKVREEIADRIFEVLKKDVKQFKKTCRDCGEELPLEHEFPICDRCYHEKRRSYYYE